MHLQTCRCPQRPEALNPLVLGTELSMHLLLSHLMSPVSVSFYEINHEYIIKAINAYLFIGLICKVSPTKLQIEVCYIIGRPPVDAKITPTIVSRICPPK